MKNIFFSMLILLFVTGCTSNQIYRSNSLSNSCYKNSCNSNVIEQHKNKSENYDLAFIEFSDRGNLFDREKYNKVINYITEQRNNINGVAVFVYVHGWKHNASNEKNGDVENFRKVLKIASETNQSKRKIVGVYIGWRGSSLNIPLVNTITYWGRKRVAHQVGSGGLTEVLLKIENIMKSTNEEKNKLKNSYSIIGHSFGAAAVLTATKEIIIQKIINSDKVHENTNHPFQAICKPKYVKTSSFGDGIFLLNPAIEATEMLQIKELINQNKCYSIHQPKLLHILTSKKDLATKYLFYIGQELGVSIPERQTKFIRNFKNHHDNSFKEIKIYEEGFDSMTIGNAPHYRTHTIDSSLNVIPCKGDASCFPPDDPYKQKQYNIPVAPYEPISVVYVDPKIIKDHNDITNSNVASYIATAILSNQDKRDDTLRNNENVSGCYKNSPKEFSFSRCINHYQTKYKAAFHREFSAH